MPANTPLRQRIIDSALTLFAKDGYDSTSVQNICQMAGVSKGAFYHHFASKQALFLNMMDDWTHKLVEVASGAVAPGMAVPEAFLAMNAHLAEVFKAAPTGFPILVDFWRQAALRDETWEKAFAPYHDFLKFFEGLIRQGIAEGSLRAEIDAKQTSYLLVAFYMGFLLQAALYRDSLNWTELSGYGLRQIFAGLGSVK